MRPTKERLEQLRTWGCSSEYPIDEVFAEIDALEKERDEAVLMQHAIEDGSAEWESDARSAQRERDRLREALDQARVTLGYLNRCGIEHAGKAHEKIREILGEQDDAQAAQDCQHVYGDKGLTCFKCGQDVSHLKESP